MSDPQSSPYPAANAFESYNNDYAKQQYQQAFDFLPYHAPADVLAPHPDLFESELDSNLAAFDELQLQLLTVDSNDAYSFLRSDTPTCGPPSTITVSSESAYDSVSSHSESFYNYPQSPYAATNYSFPLDLEMDFQRIRVDPVADYANAQAQAQAQLSGLSDVDAASFGSLPPTPPRSPPNRGHNNAKPYAARTSYSDYGAPTRGPISSDYYHLNYGTSLAAPTVSPSHVTAPLPVVPSSIPLNPLSEDMKGDPRKKYKCNVCPRAFARAYNLKTHMATHDPNRLKPHVCPHRACGRSFSRKHDLGRHLISIHRDESVCSSHHSASSKKSIGVEKGPRTWCESCGKGFVGRNAECECNDVK